MIEDHREIEAMFRRLESREGSPEHADAEQVLKQLEGVPAPTRPHPSAPDSPPANKLLAPPTGLVDRVRDALTYAACCCRHCCGQVRSR
ncbi:MAG: hypothetical protein GEV07_07875 [Streptosporangiales bacterium]|nr:hypothetical protein [Streptosporangiales bacterium]